MKKIYTRSVCIGFFALLSSFAWAHKGDYLAISNVKMTETQKSYVYTFHLQNVSQAALMNVQIEFWINEKPLLKKQYGYIPCTVQVIADQFEIDKNLLSVENDKVQIEITQIFGKKADWGGWDDEIKSNKDTTHQTRQVNTFMSEFYADAPWRMKKTDANGNLLSIPVHFFLHDANLPPSAPQIDKINIQLKNANASSFGPVLTFNTIPDAQYKSYFSSPSANDANLNIKTFSLNSFTPTRTSTIDFNETTGWYSNYTVVGSKFWYFTFNIPSYLLAGMNNEIDIRATIVYGNIGWANDVVGMRVFRSDYAIPALPNYYRGDTHLHSMYTQNNAETGLPLSATKKAGSLIGLDWITTTDHTCDFDNYGVSIASNWARIQTEARQLNNQDTSLIYIAAQELSANNSKGEIVHFLTYPNPSTPYLFPFLGDGGGDMYPTGVSLNSALLQMNSTGAFGYAAHPFATEDKLSTFVNGGVWNVGNPNFPSNGHSFPVTGGNIICNNLSVASDVFSTQPNKLFKDGLYGAQIWNDRSVLKTNDDQLDPWDVDNSGTSLAPADTALYTDHIKRFRQGQEIVSFMNQLGLSLKNQNTNYQNWKFYFSAGADAHGSFNSSNTSDFAGLGTISDNAVGKLTTLVHCPSGMGKNGENVLTALRKGRSSLSDGPVLTMGISSDGANATNEIFMGDDAIVRNADTTNYYINFGYSTTPEFGTLTKMTFIVGTSSGERKIPIAYPVASGTINLRIKLTSLLETLFGRGNILQGNYFYIRSEMQTVRNLSGQSAVYRKNYSLHHSFTNPIWLKFDDNASSSPGVITGINVAQQVKQFLVYPNPAKNKVFIQGELAEDSQSILSVYNSVGQTIFSETISGSRIHTDLDVSNYSRGIYLIQLQTGKSIISNRVMVEK